MLRARRDRSGEERPSRSKRRIRKLRLLSFISALGLLAFVSFSFGFITALGSGLGQLDPEQLQKSDVDGRILASDG